MAWTQRGWLVTVTSPLAKVGWKLTVYFPLEQAASGETALRKARRILAPIVKSLGLQKVEYTVKVVQ